MTVLLQLLFLFVQINDVHIHYGNEKDNPYPMTNEKLRWVVDESNRLSADFVIVAGDLIHGEKESAIIPDMKQAKSILDNLDCVYYPVIGNHETIQQSKLIYYFQNIFGLQSNYTFIRNNILFIAFDNGNEFKDRVWLENIVRTNADFRIIIICHVPLILVRDEKVLSRSFGFVSYVDKETFNTIKKYPNVIAVISGHLHLTGVAFQDGITQIVCSGLASLPCDYIIYEVYADSIVGNAYSLPEHFTSVSESLHGKPRWKIDYTDDEHPTHNQYIYGNPSERNFKIIVKGDK